MPHTPEQPVPPDPKEAVEARLCAYLEGDLADDERAEIERHLANSPQHQKLLADLSAVRTWTRQLPREPAPADLAEQFQQQVERSMLLDPAGPRPAPRRWLVAAVLLLTAGGAAVVSTVLIRRPMRQTPVAVRTPASREETATVPAGADNSLGDLPPGSALTGVQPLPSRAFVPAVVVPAEADEPYKWAADALAAAGGQPSDGTRVVALVVAAPLPAAAVDHAVGFLRDNRLAWDGPTGGEATRRSGFARAKYQAALGAQQNRQPADQAVAPAAENIYGNVAAPGKQNAVLPSANQTANTAPATADAGKPADDAVLVVRDLTPAQVRDLTAALSAGGGTVRSSDLPPALAAGDQLDVTIPQLAGPGIDRTNLVRVAADGTVALPMLTEPVPAAGGTAADLERRIAERYRTANLIPAATVTVAIHGRAATTRGPGTDRVTVVVTVRPSNTPPTTNGGPGR